MIKDWSCCSNKWTEKAQIEDDKRTEENLRIQLLKKEDSCHLLELEVEDLRKKDKNENAYIKFKDSSTILDKILYSQRSPTDKSGLGFNNTNGEIQFSKKTPSWMYDMNTPSSRRPSEAIDQDHAQFPFNKQSHKIYVQKENQETSSSCQNSFGEDTSSGCN